MTVPQLVLNQGDPSEARAYYCAHFVAAERGFFAEAGVAVQFAWAQSGGGTIWGGQLPAVIDGTADLAIGGPMVVMRMVEDGEIPVVAFCAAVACNPWVLVAAAGRERPAAFSLADLKHRVVCDIGRIGTATMAFGWVLRQHGISADDLRLEPGSGDEASDIAAVASGAVEYGLHSLHALGPAVAAGRVVVVADLAGLTGKVPWSAYIARPDRIVAAPAAFAAFTRAIGTALAWIAAHDAAEVAACVGAYYPGYPAAGLLAAIAGYKASGVFATDPLIPRRDHDDFVRILMDAGWLQTAVPYESVVDPTLAIAALRS